MVFSSMTFLYLFFPFAFLGIFIKKIPIQNIFLLIISLIFYAWGEPKTIILMVLAAFVAYINGILGEKCKNTGRIKLKTVIYIITIIILVGNLFIFKYLGFFTSNLSFLGLKTIELELPIGISFYTFQILSYVIDRYHERVGLQKNFFYLLMYVCFFPQLIAGPIVKYETIEEEIRNRHITLSETTEGMRRFIIGFSKKVLIANQVATIATIIYEGDKSNFGTLMYWLAAIAYSFQIYFDFSGYSDMAIGLGKIYGFHFLENFNYPYISTSITDFWRRWHISLSSWFRDYIYIPLGGNRVSKPRWIMNIFIVWILTGFWHGADWNFILWGLYYGILLITEKLFLNKILKKLPKIIRWLYSMVIVIIGWVIFNLVNISDILYALKMMFGFVNIPLTQSFSADVELMNKLLWLPVAAVFSTPILKKIKIKNEIADTIIKDFICGILLIICITFTLSESFNPFIYFRF